MKQIMFFCLLVLHTLLFSLSAQAVTLPEKAAMVIRLDRNVPLTYERSLQKVVQASKSLKPETFFDIISVVPQTGTHKANDTSLSEWATANTSKVVQLITSYGVDTNNIRVTYQPDTTTTLNEIHIYVR